jgi:hypothetical protein
MYGMTVRGSSAKHEAIVEFLLHHFLLMIFFTYVMWLLAVREDGKMV